jgi:hypothetical protein
VLLVALNWGLWLVGNDKSTTAAILAQRIAAKIEGCEKRQSNAQFWIYQWEMIIHQIPIQLQTVL